MTPTTVRAKRIALNLSVRAVARAIGISHCALSRYENESLDLSPEVLNRVGELLGLDRLRRARRQLRRSVNDAHGALHTIIQERTAS